MHYMVQGIGPKAKGLAVFFSVAGLFGVLPAFTANQLVQTLVDVVAPHQWTSITDPWTWKLILGLTLSALTVAVIFGGLKENCSGGLFDGSPYGFGLPRSRSLDLDSVLE